MISLPMAITIKVKNPVSRVAVKLQVLYVVNNKQLKGNGFEFALAGSWS